MLKTWLIALAFIALTASAHAGNQSKLGPNPALTGGEYTTGGGLTVAMETRNIAGNLALCGVWAQSASMSVYSRRAAPRVLAKGVARLNGQVIARNFGFLNRVAPAENYAGSTATCIVLNRAWRAQDATTRLELRIPRQKLLLSSSTGRDIGPQVFFVRSDSRNPAMLKGTIVPSRFTHFLSREPQF